MKTKLPFSLFSITLLFLVISCTSEEDPIPCSVDEELLCEFYTGNPLCDDNTDWDSLGVRNELLGEWKKEFMFCSWTGTRSCYIADNNSVVFHPDQSLDVKNNGEVVRSGEWKVLIADSIPGQQKVDYELNVEPQELSLIGIILFCDNDRLIFSDSPWDGCDNHYRKIN